MFDALMDQIAPRFARVEPRRRARGFVLGLLSGLPSKNCWTISEQAGDDNPDGMQHLLRKAVWDDAAVRDDLRGYVVEHLGDAGAVLVVDETGDVKKGVHTVGMQRQYTGTAGRIENAQVAVYLTYATDAGHAFIDRALYLPKSWTGDTERRAAAGIPTDTEFATKPALATTLVTRALDAGVKACWVAGDEVYGADPGLRAELETRGVGYVLAIGCKGTPQGGVVSPMLLNIALHGMEQAARVRYLRRDTYGVETRTDSPVLVRYADDFVVMCHTRQQAEQVWQRLGEWLAPRGLAFNEDKTHIVHVDHGFEFLGFNIRRYRGKLLIKPSPAAVKRIRQRLAAEVRSLPGSQRRSSDPTAQPDHPGLGHLLPGRGLQRGVLHGGPSPVGAPLPVGVARPPEQAEALGRRQIPRHVQLVQTRPVGLR
jgi:hypothetical protein